MSTVIKVEGVGKQYRLGLVGSGSLSADVNRFWAKLRGKEDPYLKIGESNDRTKSGGEYVWALKDINFEVKQGEILGIIGKNGAGKSTLLKILSRVTRPSVGNIKVKGRIASLLEVGTGFHPELTGRENIFLNGAILGMSKAEIKSKFDEIVEFSGVAKYIDTPVKRYSSGMYVRLAFAVAAHLEPEILIVDEVLAVGDAEFQKKAIGKMQEVSQGGGRTVLFVSHNMAAVKSFCTNGVLIKNGCIDFIGNIDETINNFLSNFSVATHHVKWPLKEAPGNHDAKLLEASVNSASNNNGAMFMGDAIDLEFVFFHLNHEKTNLDVTIHLADEMSNIVFVSGSGGNDGSAIVAKNGFVHAKVQIPANLLHEGTYTIKRLLLVKNRGFVLYEHQDILSFSLMNFGQGLGWIGRKEGIVRPVLDWHLQYSEI